MADRKSDLNIRGAGEPGRAPFTGVRLIIPRLGVDAALATATVTDTGQMPPPPSLTEIVWYDFSIWPGLGGSPASGGNIVLGGDAFVPAGTGVLARLTDTRVGDYVRMTLMKDEPLCYRVEFNKVADPAVVDFTQIVHATPTESVTLISGAAPTTRRMVWGRRADCSDETPVTPISSVRPTPVPPAGHYKLHVLAENYQFTVLEGATVPKGIHTVDVTLDVRDVGVEHSIAFFDPRGIPINSIEPVRGPTTISTVFGVGPPQPPGRYTFHCTVHPQMTGYITVES